jgi:Tfp pilus assembly protein PilO
MRPVTQIHGKLRLVFLFTAVICCLALLLLIVQSWGYIQLTKELVTARQKLAHTDGVINAIENRQGKLLELHSKIADLEKLFQVEMRDGAHLFLLGQLSKAMGVEINGVEPEKIKEHPQIIEIPLVLSVKGNYLDILAFCQELEDNSLQNLTVIRHIKVTAGRKSPEKGRAFEVIDPADASELVNTELGISIYTAKNPQNKYSFDWEKGSQPSIFHHQPALPEFLQTEEGSQPQP